MEGQLSAVPPMLASQTHPLVSLLGDLIRRRTAAQVDGLVVISSWNNYFIERVTMCDILDYLHIILQDNTVKPDSVRFARSISLIK